MTVGEDFDELKSIIESWVFSSPDPVVGDLALSASGDSLLVERLTGHRGVARSVVIRPIHVWIYSHAGRWLYSQRHR